jgi:hypothetical protein
VSHDARADQRRALRHGVVLALTGSLACGSLVFAVGRSLVPVGMVLPDAFGGILSPTSHDGGVPAAIAVVSSAVLLWCWWYLLAEATAGRLRTRRIAWIVIAWVLPILPGPPLLSFDAYAYLAQGTMVAHGLDPYAAGPVTLGSDPALSRVDPLWRSTPSPYGPVPLLLLRLVVMGHAGLTAEVLALRLLALLGVIAAVIGALLLSDPARRPVVLVLTLANPMTLLHLLGGVHIDAVLAGLVVLSLLALHAGRARAALVFAGIAVACKVTVLPLFLLVLLVLVRRRGPRVVWLALAVLVAPFVATGLVLDQPWGFLHAVLVPGAAAPWYAPASLVGFVLTGAATLVHVPLADLQAHLMGLGIVLATGAILVAKTFWSAWLDTGPDAHRRDVRRAGVVLLVSVLALPALFGWYLGPALFVVAAVPGARGRGILVVLCSLLSFSSLPVMYGASPWLLAPAWLVALGICVAGVRRYRRQTRPADTPKVVPGPAAEGIARTAPDLVPVDVGPAVRRAPRGLLTAVRAGEIAVAAALMVLVAVPGADATDTSRYAHQADLASRAGPVNKVGELVRTAYPGRQLARVLAQPGQETTGVGDFDVELVLPGKEACWVQISVAGSGGAVRLADQPRGHSSRRPPCPEPVRAGDPPAHGTRGTGPR